MPRKILKKNIKNKKNDEFFLSVKILENLPQGIDIVDENCRIVYLNKFLLKKVGKSVIGKKCYQIYKADKKQCVACPLKQSIKVGATKKIEVRNILGETVYSIIHKGIKIGGKKYILEVFEDITERKANEERDKKMSDIIEKNAAAIALVDLGKTNMLWYVNKAWEKMFGYNREEVVGKRQGLIIEALERNSALKTKLNDSIKNGRIFSAEMAWKHKNGKLINVEVLSTPLRDKNGNIYNWFNTIRDISEFKETREELFDKQQKLNAILSDMGEGLFVVDNNNIIIMFNRMAELLSGFSAKQVIGSRYDKFIKFVFEKTNLSNDNFIKDYWRGVNNNGFINDLFLLKKNKQKLPISTSISPLKNKEGIVIGLIVLFRDISREKEIDKMKTDFVSLASHQLKTPLTGIKWFSELLLKGKCGVLNGKQMEYIQKVFDSNERLINLVDDLLNVSRINSGVKFDIVTKPTDIVKIMEDVLRDKVKLIKKQRIKVIKSSDALKKCEILVDEKRIWQVFDNLISNAIKYSHIGGTVELNCKKEGNDKIIFYVKDEGIGIPKYQQNKVFERFFRGDNAIIMQTDGTGLGLYIAKAGIEAHSGKMWFESKLNQGSTFYFSLPLSESTDLSG